MIWKFIPYIWVATVYGDMKRHKCTTGSQAKSVSHLFLLYIIGLRCLKWEHDTIDKATRLLGFLRCNLWNWSQALKELSYKQFILPVHVLEYAVTVWDLYHLKVTNKMEMVQQRAARFVLNRPWWRNVGDSTSEML